MKEMHHRKEFSLIDREVSDGHPAVVDDAIIFQCCILHISLYLSRHEFVVKEQHPGRADRLEAHQHRSLLLSPLAIDLCRMPMAWAR
jgi:hypothetical protein